MNFQNLRKIEDADFYLDHAFKASRKHGEEMFRRLSGAQIDRIRRVEIEKLKVFHRTIAEKFSLIIKDFPSIDSMNEFYYELVKATLDIDNLKKSLGAIDWAIKRIDLLSKDIEKKLRRTEYKKDIDYLMRAYYGRISSIIKQVSKNLAYLEESRRVMRDYPALKTDLFTVAITGFPNIGKSTLLAKITPAKPKIADYSFTTKGLNQGYADYGLRKIQFVDTPGVLNRDHHNPIEEQAYLVLKYLVNLIIYVIDLTEPYPIKKQEELLKDLKDYDKPIIVYLSKSDILDSKRMSSAKRKYKAAITIEELDKRINKSLKEYYFN